MLPELIKKHPLALLLSVAGHILIVALLVINNRKSADTAAPVAVEPMKAVVIDAAKVNDAAKKLKDIEKQKLAASAAKRKNEEDALRRLTNKRKKEEERLKKAAVDRAALEKKRKEESAKLAQLEKQRQAELKKKEKEKQETERKRKETQKRQAEKEKQRKEEEKRKALERERVAALEAERVKEEARLKAVEAKRQADSNRKEVRRLQGLNAQYKAAVGQKIQRNWIKPPGLAVGIKCEVTVIQLPTGDIVEVSVQRCTGGGDSFRRSVENAVWKSDPLPQPPDAQLFQRQINITFAPDN